MIWYKSLSCQEKEIRFRFRHICWERILVGIWGINYRDEKKNSFGNHEAYLGWICPVLPFQSLLSSKSVTRSWWARLLREFFPKNYDLNLFKSSVKRYQFFFSSYYFLLTTSSCSHIAHLLHHNHFNIKPLPLVAPKPYIGITLVYRFSIK